LNIPNYRVKVFPDYLESYKKGPYTASDAASQGGSELPFDSQIKLPPLMALKNRSPDPSEDLALMGLSAEKSIKKKTIKEEKVDKKIEHLL
jgi:hypothetical protein